MSETKQLSIKEIIKLEYEKCAKSPIYFMKKYVYIQTTSKGRALFQLYAFQSQLLNLFHKKDRLLVLKSRQLGITTLCAGYALWLMLFKTDQSILALAPTQDKAKNIVDKVRFGYKNLPSWLKEGSAESLEDNKLSLVLKNGSKIKAASGASDSARGSTANVLILDEAAFIDNADELWGSAQQTLATGGQAIVLSTPNGVSNWFHKQWVDAELQDNEFLPVRLPWNLHPERDENWRAAQTRELGAKLAAQECDAEFMQSGDTYFDSDDLNYYRERIEQPILTRGPNKDLWVWEEAMVDRSYMVVVDTSRGDSNDFSTIQVLDIFSGVQVAEFRSDVDTKILSKLAVSLSVEYNNALLVIENTGIGQTTVSDVIEMGYTNIYYSPKGDSSNVSDYITKFYENDISKMTPGFTCSTKTRPLILHSLRQYVKEHSIQIRSARTVSEMGNFIWKNGKPQAQSGYNDDLVIPYAIGLYLRDSAVQYRSDGIEIQKSTLSNFRKASPTVYQSKPSSANNPYKMNVNGQMEDISWLLL